jgi:hypothetical protein
VIVDRFFPDEDGNRSRRFVEYTVRDIVSGEFYNGVRKLSDTGGLDDGEENILRPATATLPEVGRPFSKYRAAREVDGDVVTLGFIEGVRSRGVIMGVIRHYRSEYGAQSADGARRFYTHQGTSRTVGADGSYLLARGTTGSDGNDRTVSFQIAADGTVQLNSGRGAVIQLDEEEVWIQSTVRHVNIDAELDVLIGANSDISLSALGDIEIQGNVEVFISSNEEIALEAPLIKLGDTATQGAMIGGVFYLSVSEPTRLAAILLKANVALALASLTTDPTGVTAVTQLCGALTAFAQTLSTSLDFVPSAVSEKVLVE